MGHRGVAKLQVSVFVSLHDLATAMGGVSRTGFACLTAFDSPFDARLMGTRFHPLPSPNAVGEKACCQVNAVCLRELALSVRVKTIQSKHRYLHAFMKVAQRIC
jgi:phage gp36-like protein